VYATDHSSRTHWDAQAYAPCYPTSCCPVNAVAVVPEFVRGMLLRDRADNVHIMAYGPCSLEHDGIALTVNTLYPFRNTVAVEIECDKEFSLYLRVPSFALGYTLKVNGETEKAEAENGFVSVRRFWRNGDVIEISFEAKVETVVLHDDDCCGNHPIAVRYGALVYSYHIPEKWSRYEGRAMTKLPEGWYWYRVTPSFEEYRASDPHERLGMRREQIGWNIAIDEHLCAEDFQIEEIDTGGYVWEEPMIKLHTHAYKATHMFPPYPQTTYEPYGEYQTVSERVPLTLVPYGCTNLRITYFPKAKLD